MLKKKLPTCLNRNKEKLPGKEITILIMLFKANLILHF